MREVVFYRSYQWHTEVVKEERLTFTSVGGRMSLVSAIYLHNNTVESGKVWEKRKFGEVRRQICSHAQQQSYKIQDLEKVLPTPNAS